MGPCNIRRQTFIILNLHPISPPPLFLLLKMTTLHVLRIHNNWNGPDILDHFFNFDSFQGIVLVVRVLDNPLAMGSHHSKIYWILVAQGVTTSPILGVGKILANNCLSNNKKKTPIFGPYPSPKSHILQDF